MQKFVSRMCTLLVVVLVVGSCGDDGRFPVEPRFGWLGDGPCDPNHSEICVCDEFHPDYPDCLPPPCNPALNPGCEYRVAFTQNPQRMDSLYTEGVDRISDAMNSGDPWAPYCQEMFMIEGDFRLLDGEDDGLWFFDQGLAGLARWAYDAVTGALVAGSILTNETLSDQEVMVTLAHELLHLAGYQHDDPAGDMYIGLL